MSVSYEWDIEEMDGDGDEIIDHNHRDRLRDYNGMEMSLAFSGAIVDGKSYCLVLVRTESEGSRLWAYVVNDKLPEYFSRPEADGEYYKTDVRVPQRFHTELERWAVLR